MIAWFYSSFRINNNGISIYEIGLSYIVSCKRASGSNQVQSRFLIGWYLYPLLVRSPLHSVGTVTVVEHIQLH